jgi:hypothetical protein
MKVTNSVYCLEYHPEGFITIANFFNQASSTSSALDPKLVSTTRPNTQTNHESTWPSAFIFCGLSVDTSRLARANIFPTGQLAADRPRPRTRDFVATIGRW